MAVDNHKKYGGALPEFTSFADKEIQDSKEYYRGLFEALIRDIECYRDEKYPHPQYNVKEVNPIFNIEDKEQVRYANLLDTCRKSIKRAMIYIAEALLKRQHYNLITPTIYNDLQNRRRDVSFFDFIILQKEIRTGFIVTWDIHGVTPLEYRFETIKDLNVFQEVERIIYLPLIINESNEDLKNKLDLIPNEDRNWATRDRISHLNNLIAEKYDDRVAIKPFYLFIREMVGADELALLKEAIETFNINIKEIIGYHTTFMPNTDEVIRFKKRTVFNLNKNYKEMLINHLEYMKNNNTTVASNIESLKQSLDIVFASLNQHFCIENRFSIFGNDSDYADSFLSAEWYYSSSFSADVLDKTPIAVGYIKSVEQLLYQIIKLKINCQGFKYIRRRNVRKKEDKELQIMLDNLQWTENRNKYVPFRSDFESYFDLTLGKISDFYQEHKEIFISKDFPSEWKSFIIECLKNYRIFQRNEHLHKDNIYCKSQINEIRDTTILLYFLLIGSLNSDSVNLNDLHIDAGKDFLGITYNERLLSSLSKWLDDIFASLEEDDPCILLDPFKDISSHCDSLRCYLLECPDDIDFESVNSVNAYDSLTFSCLYLGELPFKLDDDWNQKEKGEYILSMLEKYKKSRDASATSPYSILYCLYDMGWKLL